jgi:hypothetical protein
MSPMIARFFSSFEQDCSMNGGWILLLPLLLLKSFCCLGVDSAPAAPALAASADSTNKIVTLPFEFSRGHIVIRARINESEPLYFMLDSGYSMPMIRPDLAESLKLKQTGKVTIVGIAGDERADVFEGATFDLAGATYSPRRVGALPSANKSRSRKRDGVLGYGFFRRFVVEIDHQAKTIKLHDPASYTYTGEGERIPLRFRNTAPIVTAEIKRPGRAPISGQFEIDTGCDGGLCLGQKFVEANQLRETADVTEDSVRKGVGGDTRTVTGSVPQFQLGQIIIEKPQADFFLDGSPVDDGLAGHIGIEILRRFKVIFDYSRKQLFLESYQPSPKESEKKPLPLNGGKSD